MTFRLFVTSAAVVSALFAAHPAAQGPAATPITDPNMYAVYGALLSKDWNFAGSATKVALQAETVPVSSSCLPSGPSVPDEWKPVLDDYRAANREPHVLLPGQPVGVPYILVPRSDTRAVVSDGLFEQSERYPDSGGRVVYVSAVGFDRAHTRALVFAGYYCGSLCSTSGLQQLERRNGVWRRAAVPLLETCLTFS